MNALALLDELLEAGIRLCLDGDELMADVLPDANLDSYRERIQERKEALVATLRLRDEIVAAASVEPECFNRDAYEGLWRQWRQWAG
jgi:hypothetical protein